MKRLTERDECGNVYIIALDDIMSELYAELSFSEINALTEALNRLAAYEDTGLLPEEMIRITGERRRLGDMGFYVNPALKAMGAPLFAKEERG